MFKYQQELEIFDKKVKEKITVVYCSKQITYIFKYNTPIIQTHPLYVILMLDLKHYSKSRLRLSLGNYITTNKGCLLLCDIHILRDSIFEGKLSYILYSQITLVQVLWFT